MRFQPKGPSRFLLVRFPLSETASPLLYFTRLPTFHSSFRIGSGSLLGSLLPPFPTPTWVRLSSSMSPSHPAPPSIATPTTGTGGVCPSVCLSHWAASSVRKGGGHLPSQNPAQSWTLQWPDDACSLVLLLFIFLHLLYDLILFYFYLYVGKERLHNLVLPASEPLEVAECSPACHRVSAQHTRKGHLRN